MCKDERDAMIGRLARQRGELTPKRVLLERKITESAEKLSQLAGCLSNMQR
jgi:hypothetical protein